MLFLSLLVLAIAIAFFFLQQRYQYWAKRGVKGPKPLPIFGNVTKSLLFQAIPGTVYSEIYKKFKNEEIVGAYRGTTPILILVDPEAIKEVTTKSFSSFHDNDIYVDKKEDPIFGRNPLVLKGEEWKSVRSLLTPGFTSGKMKWVYPLLEETGANLVKYIDNMIAKPDGKGSEAKELSIRFTLDNVASCAFGIQGKCFEEENSEFMQLAKDMLSLDGWTIALFTLAVNFPKISTYIPFRIIPETVEHKLVDMVSATLKYREDNNVIRNDFLQILREIKNKNNDYTELDVTAHAAGFFGDGSETSATVMSFTLYELAANPKIQDRLRDEVNAAFEDNDQKLPYDVVQGLPLLEAVIHEALRLHPPVFALQRVCTQNFTYTPSNGQKEVTIEKGTPMVIPIYGLHHDPDHFEDPEVYDPDRFLEENKDRLKKHTFMPFGEGPRSCLGRRFGILQIKVGIANIIRNFEISVHRKTQVPIKYHRFSVLTSPVGGLWLNYKKLT